MKRYILAQWDGDLVMVSTDRESVVYPQNTDVEWVRYTDTQKVCEWEEKTTNIFETKCKNAIYTDWTSDFEYCPFCGGKIEVIDD